MLLQTTLYRNLHGPARPLTSALCLLQSGYVPSICGVIQAAKDSGSSRRKRCTR